MVGRPSAPTERGTQCLAHSMRNDVAEHARQRFLPIGINVFQNAFETATELDIAADLQLACSNTGTRKARKYRERAAQCYVRCAIVLPNDAQTLRGRQDI